MLRTLILLSAIVLGTTVFATTSPLTPEQKQLVLDTLQSENLALTVSRSVSPNMTPAKATTDAVGQKFATMLTALQNQLKSGACVASATSVSNGNMTGSCMWAYSLNVQVSNPAGGPQSNTRFTSFNVTDPAVIAVNDITGITGTNGGNMILATTTDPIVGTKVTGSGILVSQTLGNIAVTATGSGTFDSSLNPVLSVEMDIQFPGFPAALVIQKTGSGETYTLNGQPLGAADLAYISLPALQPTPKAGAAVKAAKHTRLPIFR